MIIVTGSGGFIGKHLCTKLRAQGHHLLTVDNSCPEADLADDILYAELPDKGDVQRVYHLAAQTDAYHPDAMDDAQTNILGSVRVFEKYREKVVFTSSAMVNYPINPYAISKKAAEDYARYYGSAVVRLCNIYGPGGHSFIDKCETQDTITIFGSGNQLRTWSHVDNAVDALLRVYPGEKYVLHGFDASLKEIAARYDKPIRYENARANDLTCALQIVPD